MIDSGNFYGISVMYIEKKVHLHGLIPTMHNRNYIYLLHKESVYITKVHIYIPLIKTQHVYVFNWKGSQSYHKYYSATFVATMGVSE